MLKNWLNSGSKRRAPASPSPLAQLPAADFGDELEDGAGGDTGSLGDDDPPDSSDGVDDDAASSGLKRRRGP